jgi:hypothetical protein
MSGMVEERCVRRQRLLADEELRIDGELSLTS